MITDLKDTAFYKFNEEDDPEFQQLSAESQSLDKRYVRVSIIAKKYKKSAGLLIEKEILTDINYLIQFQNEVGINA